MGMSEAIDPAKNGARSPSLAAKRKQSYYVLVAFPLCLLYFIIKYILSNNPNNEEPQGKTCGIEDFSLKSLRMRGNKSPAPPPPV
jgi:hypothetical protein